MTTIHFVKDGKRPNGDRVTKSHDVPFPLIQHHLLGYVFEYFSSPPTINPEVHTSDFAEYRHVVIEVSESDAGKTPFAKTGYYYVTGLSPAKCCELLGISP
jgi:hypothetical protein